VHLGFGVVNLIADVLSEVRTCRGVLSRLGGFLNCFSGFSRFFRCSPERTTAAAVSSQELSMPRM